MKKIIIFIFLFSCGVEQSPITLYTHTYPDDTKTDAYTPKLPELKYIYFRPHELYFYSGIKNFNTIKEQEVLLCNKTEYNSKIETIELSGEDKDYFSFVIVGEEIVSGNCTPIKVTFLYSNYLRQASMIIKTNNYHPITLNLYGKVFLF